MVLCFMFLLITYGMPQCIISDPAYYFLGSVKSVFSAVLFPDIGLIPNRLTQLIINVCKRCSGVINKISVPQKKNPEVIGEDNLGPEACNFIQKEALAQVYS